MTSQTEILDVALIGGGIMSTTLGTLIDTVLPNRSTALFERLDHLAGESSGPWKNAGTGHAGLCELNYMPDPEDPSRAEQIAHRFQVSRQFWSALQDLNSSFLNSTPHMNVVFGETDIEYLRRRWSTMRTLPLFRAMEFTDDADTVRQWAPLLMEGRSPDERVAATRHAGGTDIDFGALTQSLGQSMEATGCMIRTGHEITGLRRGRDGIWTLSGRIVKSGKRFHVRSRFVFVGAGGYALRLLQKSGIPEIDGYGVFPFGAEFLRTDIADIVDRHDVKVYGRPSLGAPPMSLPHLDKRMVDGRGSLMFGPYATFSTRLLAHGRLRDLFTTIRPRNLPVLLSVGLQNLPLVRYLIAQLLSSDTKKFEQLRQFYTAADPADWYRIQAGQRAQLIKPTSRYRGELMFGTEIITGADGSIAGLLGASPGASVAPAAMIEVLERCFDSERAEWEPRLRRLIPAAAQPSSAI
ncbi:malate dehydrogenase (quinone) [Rhodococcus sovatensis]|uniref:Probable malate:quinone oxidoreductase n=1 Tax=Rhodococcus sovatensis TaxID=1805840 RepID=A0ABZ2PG74_9NOCA